MVNYSVVELVPNLLPGPLALVVVTAAVAPARVRVVVVLAEVVSVVVELPEVVLRVVELQAVELPAVVLRVVAPPVQAVSIKYADRQLHGRLTIQRLTARAWTNTLTTEKYRMILHESTYIYADQTVCRQTNR